MKIELYSLNDIHAKAIKLFLEKSKLNFKEINKNSKEFSEINRFAHNIDVSILKITKSHSISIVHGFDENFLNLNLLEHIKEYNPKIEV